LREKSAGYAFISILLLTLAVFSTQIIVQPVNATISPVHVRIGSSGAYAFGFSPPSITVVIGVNNTVIWTNGTPVYHTVTSNPGDPASFESNQNPGIAPGDSYQHTFTIPGTYSYHCIIHPYMMGKIIVKAAQKPTQTKITCSKTTFAVSSKVTCTATVSGAYPSRTGTITWTKLSGKGSATFSSKTCTLIAGKCSVTEKGTVAGSLTIEATYSGDSHNSKSVGTLALTVS